MSRRVNQVTEPCCAPVSKGIQLLIFPDGSQVGVNGLERIFDDAYREGKRPDQSFANELVRHLSENNYIPSVAWSEYEEVVLKEYRKFFEAKEKSVADNI
jgi:hypothetical protein